MRRLRATAALVLTAFFAVAGAYHHHHPRTAHDHVGLCSESSAIPGLESCALCKAAHTAAERLEVVTIAGGLDTTSSRTVASELAPSTLNASLLHSSRAPPAA